MIRHRHLPTKRLNVTPTAIGRISGGEPGLSFETAMRLPPPRNLETTKEPFWMLEVRVEQIVFCNVTSAAFSRGWIRNSDGPHVVAFGKDVKTDKILKSGGRIGGVVR